MKYAIGIDLGTTHSCVAVWQNGKVEVILNESGNRTTPSYVAFTDVDRLIGEAAKDQKGRNLKNTVYDVKRMIGKRFDDEKVQEDIKNWSFQVTNVNDQPKVIVEFKNKAEEFSPTEISSMVLSKMKEYAEKYLGCEVKDAVITVPAYFNDHQRKATRTAGELCGLKVLQIINEPTAASLAYGLSNNIKIQRNVLIFDFGGGTFDVSIVAIDQKEKDASFKVLSTSGNNHLGGNDLDNRIVEHLMKEFVLKHGVDLMDNDRAKCRLQSAAEKAKRCLSVSTVAPIELDCIHRDIDFFTKLTRAKFDDLCLDIFKETLEPVKDALSCSGLQKSQIDDVILVGGSTRILKVQSLLREFFDGKQLNMSVNPDEAVAIGAAIQAAILSGNNTIDEILLVDVTPLSLGIRTVRTNEQNVIIERGIFDKVIEKNTQIPCKKSKIFETVADNQNGMSIEIFQGERKYVKDNVLLGSFILDGVTLAPAHVSKVDVTFEIDADGILHVTAVDVTSGRSNHITIANENGRLTEHGYQEIERFQDMKLADDNKKNAQEARNQLESCIHKYLRLIIEEEKQFSEEFKRMVNEKCAAEEKWVKDENLDASVIEKHFMDLDAFCRNLLR